VVWNDVGLIGSIDRKGKGGREGEKHIVAVSCAQLLSLLGKRKKKEEKEGEKREEEKRARGWCVYCLASYVDFYLFGGGGKRGGKGGGLRKGEGAKRNWRRFFLCLVLVCLRTE